MILKIWQKSSKTLAKFIEFSLEKRKKLPKKYPLFFFKKKEIYIKKKISDPNNLHLEKKG
jgi:hypothetical protein